ncbi:MAG: peptidase S41 [Flavobacterium sp. MedPE-SWcel]|uniref:S41 family peptidase n=1 Tax=uncultured Flavobacterium sp. TaxID=165435 RepID=UPI0009199F45|nr:S41 family peptidase [uncultured Flavobacterium sp.]OIQ22112.1 MAG: peptidase S41 [Flavobacterium sp. MedPE-SWcel]
MKKILLLLVALLVTTFAFQSCDDLDDNVVPAHSFIWKGLNQYYLWQEDVPELADDRFETQSSLDSYVESFSSPNSLFENLLYERNVIDRFSVLFPDFRVLENRLQGVSKSNGVEYGLIYTDDSETSIFGYVRYILPNSDASAKDIQRGEIFYAVNGTPLNDSNYQSLLGNDTYTLNFADYDGGNITPNGKELGLTKTEYSENPVHTTNVITEGSHVIGYFMYNGFYSSYDNDLNEAFGELASQGVNELVLDLRYNSGGSVRTSTYLASMITGQFNDEIFAREQWNTKMQGYYENNNPDALINRFTNQLSNSTPINHLNLNKIYILTTRGTASASELIINCLQPYIDVTVIGDTTTGKNVGSVTLYDSANFSRSNVNGSHTYAMQPIVLEILNKNGFGDYSDGIAPDIELKEDFGNLGILGDANEPLFAAAIADITGSGRFSIPTPSNDHKWFNDSKKMRRFGTEMYIENTPEDSFLLAKDLQ